MARSKRTGMHETQTPSKTEHNKSSVRVDSEKMLIKRSARNPSKVQKTAEENGNDSGDLDQPNVKRMKPYSPSSVPTKVPASAVRPPKLFCQELLNVALQLSAGCRIGPHFDETKIRRLPPYESLPYPDLYTRVVQDLIRCAHRPEEVVAALKVSAPGEPFTIVTYFDKVNGKLECRNIPVVDDVNSAQSWLSEWLESLGCCKKLFLPDFLVEQFICKQCFQFNQEQRRGVAASGDEAASENHATQIKRENEEERKRKKAEEEKRKRIEEEKRKIAEEEKQKRIKEDNLKQGVLKEQKKKEAEKKRKEEEERRQIEEEKMKIGEEEKQKRIEEKKMNERLIEKQKKEEEKKLREEEERGRMEEEQRKAEEEKQKVLEEQKKAEEEDRKKLMIEEEAQKQKQEAEQNAISAQKERESAEKGKKQSYERLYDLFLNNLPRIGTPMAEYTAECYNVLYSVFLILFNFREVPMELRPDLKNTIISRSPDVYFVHDVRVDIYKDGGKYMLQLGDEKAMDCSVFKGIKDHMCRGDNSPLNSRGTMLDLWLDLLLHCPKCVNPSSLLKALDKVSSFLWNSEMETLMMKSLIVGEQRTEKEDDERLKKLKEEEEKRKSYNNIHALFLYYFKLPEGRTELRPDLGNPVVSNSPYLSSKHMVRSKCFRDEDKEMWQIGDEAPMDSSILKAITTHSCTTRRPVIDETYGPTRSFLNTQGTLLELWLSLLLRCPECINERCLEDALGKASYFMEMERERNLSEKYIQDFFCM